MIILPFLFGRYAFTDTTAILLRNFVCIFLLHQQTAGDPLVMKIISMSFARVATHQTYIRLTGKTLNCPIAECRGDHQFDKLLFEDGRGGFCLDQLVKRDNSTKT